MRETDLGQLNAGKVTVFQALDELVKRGVEEARPEGLMRGLDSAIIIIVSC